MRNDMVKYIRNSWLAGNQTSDVATEIFRNASRYGGILEERAVWNIINFEYFQLNQSYFCRLANDALYQQTRKQAGK